MIIEIKNSYLAKKDKERIQTKKEAIINEGYNFIMIINKDYKEIDNYLAKI